MAVGADPHVGTSLAGYRIESQVGHGGMGVVYRAHDEPLDRKVAIKLITPGLASDRAFRDRFLSEARLAASLDHPNVIPVHDAGEIDGQLYLTMRFVEGGDLRGLLIEEGPLDSERALAICGQVAAALDAAHRRGLVHRDVKPSNVLLDEDGHAYLADFGLTRRLSEQAPGFDAGLSLGTPAYVAPEQIESAGGVEAVVGPRADQYSLACMVYECLAGKPPFPRGSEAATLFAHLEEEPPTLPRLEGVLARGLAKDPADRFETCTALVDAARAGLPHTGRRRRLIAGAVLAVIAAAATAVAVVASGDDEPRVGHDWSQVPHNEAAFGRTQAVAPTGIAVGESGIVAVGSSGIFGLPDSGFAVWTSPDGVNWTLTGDDSLAEPGWQWPDDVIALGKGFVAVGSEVLKRPSPSSRHPLGDGDAAVWRSDDGTNWERVPHDEKLFGGPSYQHMADIVAGGPGLIAVGADDGIRQAAVWTSPTGERWTRVLPNSQVLGPTNPKDLPNMRRVAVAEDGRVVAAGFEWWADPEMFVAAVWASSDGLSWTRARHDGEVFGDGSTSNFVVAAVTDGGPGFIAATVETEGTIDDIFTQAVLESPGPAKTRSRIILSEDGLTWTAVPESQLPDGGEGAFIRQVTRGSSGFVAVGFRRNNPGVADGDIDPVVWSSLDGENWTEAADPAGVFTQPGGQLIHKVIAGGPGLVAIGQDGGVDGFNAAVWTSP